MTPNRFIDQSHNRISINGRFLTQPQTGVQRYSLEVLNSLDRLLDSGEIDSGSTVFDCLVPPIDFHKPDWKQIHLRQVGNFNGNLWEQIDLPLFARGSLLFAPANIGPYFFNNQVVIIHDASVFAYPEAFSFNFLMKYRTLFQHFGKLSNPIITVSEFSKREISRYCNIDLESIVVIPPGHEHFLAIQPDPSIIHRLNIQDKPFILSVGSNSPHKNTQILHSALETITRIGYDLVIVGGSFDHVFRSVEESWPPTVHVAGYISDCELRTLYEHASALIFPSFYEGFGLPVLEAMALGCPVVCSNTASMPEVGGDAVLYFDPNQPEELSRQLVELMNNSTLRDGLQTKGILQAAKFSWQNTAKRIWDILSNSMVK